MTYCTKLQDQVFNGSFAFFDIVIVITPFLVLFKFLISKLKCTTYIQTVDKGAATLISATAPS